MPQIMEGEIMNVFPLLLRGASLEGAEPVVNAFFRQPLAALRREDVDAFRIASARRYS